MNDQSLAVSASTGAHLNFEEGCITKAIAAKAAKWPDAVALTSGSRVVNYQDLDSQANQVAHHLRSLGVGPDVVVGLCLPRSPELATAALGILKAGGAYVPMDPAYPTDRLAFMLQDADAPVLITTQDIAERFPAANCTMVDIYDREISGRPDYPPHSETLRDDLAYVIYTSGSTGTPKGVEITHGGLSNLVSWHRQAFSVTPGDRASHLAGLGFDAAVWELWPYLAAGASVHMADDDARLSAKLLRDWLLARKITISFVPTPLAERLITLEWPSQAPLRILLTGGDTLHRYPSAELPFTLVNNYGPTECAVVATSGCVPPERPGPSLPHIGVPIRNTRVYLLDEKLEPVPPGSPGEICIAGAGVARGYRRHPGLTAEKFIRDPFNTEEGARLYRTGDLGCLLPGGQIAFLGRSDDQVKIRGYRIEPGEVAYVLNRHPDVRESLVVARPDASGEKRLVAYVVLSPDSEVTHSALREAVAKSLPEYMAPAAFVRLDALPLTPHGKVDRDALPEPTADNTLGNPSGDGPGSVIEQRLIGILAALLEVEQVGPEDNFFQMGGHSLLGAQVIARVRDTFAVEISLRSLFDHPTARDMAGEVERLILEKLGADGRQEPQRDLTCTEEVRSEKIA